MKNNLRWTTLLFAVLTLSFTACQKFDRDHHPRNPAWNTTTADSVITANHTMTMVLPKNLSSETPVISSSPKNASVSELFKDPANGVWMYRYTPSSGFIGTDVVTIDSEEESDDRSSGKKDKHHGCNKGEDDNEHNRLILNITIVETEN